MGRVKTYMMESEKLGDLVVGLVDSYTMDNSLEEINYHFALCLQQLSDMRVSRMISCETFDENLMDLLKFYRMVLSESSDNLTN